MRGDFFFFFFFHFTFLAENILHQKTVYKKKKKNGVVIIFFDLQIFLNLHGPAINHVLGPTRCKRAIVYTRSRISIFPNKEGYGMRYEFGK